MNLNNMTRQQIVNFILENNIQTLPQLGEHVNLTRQRISQILEKKGLGRENWRRIKDFQSLRLFRKENPSYETEEVWKSYKSDIEVSENGSVRQLKRKAFGGVVYEWYKKLNTTVCTTHGYVRCGVTREKVHRMVAEVFCEKEKGQDVINHLDGNRANNNRYNLEWCTQGENVEHAINHIRTHIASTKDATMDHVLEFVGGRVLKIHNLSRWCRLTDPKNHDKLYNNLLLSRRSGKFHKGIRLLK